MPSVTQPAEFFVVGGPVQAERPCYVERAADRRLDDALRAKRLCCVLGAHATGKSSLLQYAARSLRASGALVARVDLRRVSERGEGETPDSWLCRFAERVANELELGVDVGSWWNACETVAANRLVEFFWEIVLTNTTAPVVVLVDEVDAVLELPFAADLLDAIGGCYERRSRERDFARLGFAIAGCTSQRALAEARVGSAWAAAEIVEPEDFSSEQAYRFAVAFGGDQQLAQALIDRVCAWTGGHPYLTQRIARGVARKGGRLEDVERVVHEQLLAPGAADKDPLLRQVRAWLSESSRPARRATRLLRRLAGGGRVERPTDAAVWELLWLSGTARVDEQGALKIRNRIVRELVAAGWLKAKASGWRWVAAAAALLAAVAAGGYWYTQWLPVADIATLSSTTAQPSDAEEAWRRLRGLPGFTQRADELWLEALGRQSRAATSLAAATAADTRLRELPGQDAAADRMLSEYWLRRAREQAHGEHRDAAILLAQRAAALPAAEPVAAAYLAELVGDDYSRLERSLRFAGAPEYWHMSFAQATLVAIDAEQRVLRMPFGAAAGTGTLGAAPLELTALEHAALTRELAVDGEGTAGEFELMLTVQHAAAVELLVTLTAPSGAAAAVTVPSSDGVLVETFSFRAAQGSLAELADEGVSGVWRLTIVDRTAGNSGVFGGWGLRFGDNARRDDLSELVEIPDPQRIAAVKVQAIADRAVAWTASPGVVGSVALWNLATGQLEHDFTSPAAPRQVALDASGTRVLAATERVLHLWNAENGALVARVATETGFVLPPVFSTDGSHVAIAERVDGANPLYSVLRSADASLVATFEGMPDAQGWELGPGGRYVALQGPEMLIRVLEARRGAELMRAPHRQAVQRLLHLDDGSVLVTVDAAGTIAAWSTAPAPPAAIGREAGHTAAAASVSASADGRRLAFTRDDGAVAVLDVPTGVELYRLRIGRSLPVTSTQLSADGTELVTQSGSLFKSWRLPSKPALPGTALGDGMPTAIAIDRTSDLLAVGLASGQLQLESTGASGGSSLAFFGHRGPVSAAALNGGRGLAATGGRDGIVRLWDIASRSPTGIVMQPADAPIALVGLSADGEHVASAAGRVVRVATVADGRVVTEVRTEIAVTAVAFAPDAAAVAVGDAAGAVLIAQFAEPSEGASLEVGAAVTSLAFAPQGSRLAVADAGGSITFVAADSGETESTIRHWTQPIRWLEFSPDGSALLVATDAWLHSLAAATPALAPAQSRLVVWPASGAVMTAISATAVGFAGVAADRSLASGVLDVKSSDVAGDAATLVARDWPAALALRLNDNGEPVPFDP